MSRGAREAPAATVDFGEVPDSAVGSRPSDRVEAAEQAARLRLALAHLPPKQAGAFCLHCLEGYSYRDVAEQLGVSTNEVGVLVLRARAALRERIAWIISLDEVSP